MFTVASVTSPQAARADAPRRNRFTCATILRAAVVALATLLLGACAQQKAPGYYDTEHDTTVTDARQQAQGREHTQAPSQLQFGFGNTQKPKQANDQAAKAASETPANPRPLTEAKTFLGTIPCIVGTGACSANRITLTLAPSGEWRARTVPLDTTPNHKDTTTQQGCWHVIGIQPLRIVLQLKNDNTKANLTFLTDNILRVNRLDGVTPNLDYRLTRQADIDAINELNGQAPLHCTH